MWYFSDHARDIVIASWMGGGFGYYVLDANGRVWNGGIVPAVTSSGAVGAAPFRSITKRFRKPYDRRNAGVAFTTS